MSTKSPAKKTAEKTAAVAAKKTVTAKKVAAAKKTVTAKKVAAAKKTTKPVIAMTAHGVKIDSIKVGAFFKYVTPRGTEGKIKVEAVAGKPGQGTGLFITGHDKALGKSITLKPGSLRKNA